MRRTRQLLSKLLCLPLVLLAFNCAQDVGDIDRTQPNRIRKADLDGVWYMLETVTNVPATSRATFIGETSATEKIVWVIEEDYLFAYRSYPRFPGSDDLDRDFQYDDPGYHESPVAAFAILSHFDIQRQYDSSTGEQQNVIVENTSDRNWYDREYMRVDWSNNLITNFDFISEWVATPIELTFFQDEERGLERSVYFERENGRLVYFDLPRRLLVEPDLWGCVFSWPWYGWGTEDCTAAEVEVVTSFARTEPRRDYEPLPYDDRMMNRFGYFRSERYTYDTERGVLESGRQKMINRHNIWQQTYRRDASGNFLRDAEGDLVPIPMAEREVQTVPYYLNHRFPDDPALVQAAFDLMAEWSYYAREGVALIKGTTVDQIPEVFVACHNPVANGDHAACGRAGFEVREGDLRYSMLWWVDSEQQEGPLGYGPAAADPETGEIISGKAHIYGAGLNTYTSYGVDVIRFMNGDLQPSELVQAEHVREAVIQRAEQAANLDRVAPSLREMPLGSWRRDERQRARLERREQRRRELRPFDRRAVTERLELARESGLSSRIAGDEFERALAMRLGLSADDLTEEMLEEYDPTRWLNPTSLNQLQRRRMRALARSVDFADLFDPNVLGLARHYQGRTDYDQIWHELRALLFYAVALHEVGHTIGLRHNFQGTYDSMNYFDEYWTLRQENLIAPQNMADLYTLAGITENQINGRMREYQYSSIMDYGLTFNTDIHGGGRYDRAATVFGYTGGTNTMSLEQAGGDCSGPDRSLSPDDPNLCLVRTPGYVEIFAKRRNELGDQPGQAGYILTSQDEYGFYYDDPTTLIVPYLERWHYTTIMRSFPQLQDAFNRQWMRLDEFLRQRAAGAPDMPVRVPYLFCSDEWYEGLISCNIFDAGADPFEQTMNLVYDYRTYYYFRDFKRDRLGWWVGSPLYSYFYYVFLPVSNYYQNWYLAPWGFDDVMDDYYWLSVNVGVNLIAEALATPEYGTYCTQPNGQLFHLSDLPGLERQQTSQYYLDAYCDDNGDYVEVPQGWGRRRFTAYDIDSGYNFGAYPQEAGHVWTTMAAVWAVIDPEAFVVGAEGDIGTYSISHLDYFDEEIFNLVNAMLTEDYAVHSPVIEITGTEGLHPTGILHYPVISGVWDADRGTYINPENGVLQTDVLGPSRAVAAICQPCTESSDCNGYTGGGYGRGGVFCVRGIDEDSSQGRCTYDCEDQPSDFCPDGFYCAPSTWCLPEDDTSCDELVSECSASNLHGTCPVGQTCEEGVCIDLWPIVESNTSLSQVDDWMFWGMLYSTFGWETRFNDQINVFKMGTGEEIDPGEGFQMVSFTDPTLGDTYSAIQEDCDVETIEGGPVGICSECEEHEDCAGWIGLYYGGVFCVEMDDGHSYCLQDCGLDAAECDYLDGYECSQDYCQPETPVPGADPSCDGQAGDCSAEYPRGDCPEGLTCVDGVCHEPQAPSALCRVGWSEVPGGAQMVLKGQELVEEMNAALMAWAEYDGGDEAEDTRLYRQYSKSSFAIDWLLMEINTIRAVYDIFGKVY